MEILNKINLWLAIPFLVIVRFYQASLSPDHGLIRRWYPHGFCKFYPSCSEYARQNLVSGGVVTLPKIVFRIIRCNPFSRGGIDLPQRTNS